MQKKLKLILAVLLTTVLLAAAWGPALAAGEESALPDETQEAGETETQTEAPQPFLPLPVVTQAPATQAPAPTLVIPTPAPATPASTVAMPAETAGSVNLHLYVYQTDGTPAAGYTAVFGSMRAVTNAGGLAEFSSLPVSQQAVTITAPSGTASTGRLYLSRSNVTGVTDQAMGGTYGVDVARGLNDLYMLVIYEPDSALNIRTVSNSQPSLPTPVPALATETAQSASASPAISGEAYQSRPVTATFLDAEEQPIAGMQVAITAADGTNAALSTDSSGSIQIPNAPYGHYSVSTAAAGFEPYTFGLTIAPGVRTAVTRANGPEMEVTASTTGSHLYLQFTQSPAGLVLSEASDSPIRADMTGLIVGIIVVVAVVVIVIIAVVRYTKRRNERRGARSATVQAPVRKVNYDPSGSQGADQAPRRTGGTNKFDDRSKM
ncbi:MAG: hypothetical protein HDQ87_05760 [Clostridia bacterium]|nr:hypothetical protein [Clostridia bacterium]